MEGHEAHDVPRGWPQLRLAQRSNPLQPIGVGDRAEKAVIDKRLQRHHKHIGRIPRIRWEDDKRAAGHCVMENEGYGGKSLSLFLSLSLFSLLLPGALCSWQRLEGRKGKYGQGKEGTGETRFVFMQGKDEMVRQRNRGSFPRIQAKLIQIRFYRTRAHLFLINARTVMPCPLTPRRIQPQQQQAPRNHLKGRACHCQPMGGEYSPS